MRHRLHWREILRLVKSRIQRWLDGDLSALWSEAVAGGLSLSKRSQSSSQRNINIRKAKCAMQDGQYSKAIKALTSEGLASPSAAVLQEMLDKHPQAAPPSLPPRPCLSLPLSQSLPFVWGFGPSPVGLPQVLLACAPATFGKLFCVPLLTKLTRFCPRSPGSSIFWLPDKPLLTSPLISVVPHSWPVRRSKEATVPSLLGRCCASWCLSVLLPLLVNQPLHGSLLCSWV